MLILRASRPGRRFFRAFATERLVLGSTSVASVADELQARTERFGLRLTTFLRGLPREPVTDTIVRQLARCGSGVGSNYKSTRRARSRLEFIARLAVVLEEADESVHWLQQIERCKIASGDELSFLLDEANQLRAIFARSLQTARKNHAARRTHR